MPEPLVTVDDWEALARERLPKLAYDYFRSGADEEHTLRRNRDAYAKYEIWFRTFVDVSAPAIETTVLGAKVSAPILVAPTAYHRLAHEQGELASAAGAADAGSLFVASTLATTSLERIAEVAPDAPKWFQLYVHRDRDFTERLIERARESGYRAIAVTADTAVLGRRVTDVRNRFALPAGMAAENMIAPHPEGPGVGARTNLAGDLVARHDASFTWRDLEWAVRRAGPLPVVVKGIVRADDARCARDLGAKAIWVSNHGGRRLDFGPATVDALPEIRATLGVETELYVDGGIRSGTQALIALALGADAVFVGRPILWGLTVGGREGVRDVLALLQNELVRAMALAGAPNVKAARQDLVRLGARRLGD